MSKSSLMSSTRLLTPSSGNCSLKPQRLIFLWR